MSTSYTSIKLRKNRRENEGREGGREERKGGREGRKKGEEKKVRGKEERRKRKRKTSQTLGNSSIARPSHTL